MKITPGKLKFYMLRFMQYYSYFGSIASLCVFIKIVGWNWWYLFSIPLLAFLMWLDIKFIVKQEYNYLYNLGQIDVFKKMQKDLDEIKAKLK